MIKSIKAFRYNEFLANDVLQNSLTFNVLFMVRITNFSVTSSTANLAASQRRQN
jgi:hypothetical protein